MTNLNQEIFPNTPSPVYLKSIGRLLHYYPDCRNVFNYIIDDFGNSFELPYGMEESVYMYSTYWRTLNVSI